MVSGRKPKIEMSSRKLNPAYEILALQNIIYIITPWIFWCYSIVSIHFFLSRLFSVLMLRCFLKTIVHFVYSSQHKPDHVVQTTTIPHHSMCFYYKWFFLLHIIKSSKICRICVSCDFLYTSWFFCQCKRTLPSFRYIFFAIVLSFVCHLVLVLSFVSYQSSFENGLLVKSFIS